MTQNRTVRIHNIRKMIEHIDYILDNNLQTDDRKVKSLAVNRKELQQELSRLERQSYQHP